MLFWVFFRQHVSCPQDVYLLAGDEVVVTKTGKTTHSLERFFSSLALYQQSCHQGQSSQDLSLMGLSLPSNGRQSVD
jgi:hypothetical protein